MIMITITVKHNNNENNNICICHNVRECRSTFGIHLGLNLVSCIEIIVYVERLDNLFYEFSSVICLQAC